MAATAPTITFGFATPTALTSKATSVSIVRGRTKNLDDIPPGQAQISLHNISRNLDPSYTSGPYFGYIKPGRTVTVKVSTVTIFAGTVDDWNFTYDVSGDARADVTAVDGLALLAGRDLTAHTATAQLTGARVSAVLARTEVAYSGSVLIGTGVSSLQADDVEDGTNALEYLQLVARTEMGYLYVSNDGVLVFRDRHSTLTTTALLADDGTAESFKFHGITTSFGAELLYNRTSVSRVGGSTETFTDTTSVAEYGVRSLTFDGLLFDSDSQSYDLGLYLIGLYADPEMRISTITVKIHALTAPQQLALLSVDIGHVIRVVWTPLHIGNELDYDVVVEGVVHDISPGSHVMSFNLSEATGHSAFTLDDEVFGVLDGPGLLSF